MELEEMIDGNFFKLVDDIAEKFLKNEDGRKITVVHHNDADGICSASILKALLESLNADYRMICVEKVYPAVIKKIHEDGEGVYLYTDLGGLAAEIIERYTGENSVSFIIDHHPARKVESEKVYMLDPELAGISGVVFISASSLIYIFSRRINPEIEDYAYIALLGAVGDYHDRYGGVLGFDRVILDEAIMKKQVKIRLEGVKERYYLPFFDDYADTVSRKLTTLGAAGYLEKGYLDGIEVCFNGFTERTLEKVRRLEELKEEKFRKEIDRLRSGFNETEHIQWFSVENRFDPMGVKTIGEFCQTIKDMTFVKQDKYLIGFQNIPALIPDLGEIEWRGVKVSGRTPSQLERMVLHGKMPGLDVLIPRASERVGGHADATHKIAAATVIDIGKEPEFISAMEEAIKDETSKNSRC